MSKLGSLEELLQSGVSIVRPAGGISRNPRTEATGEIPMNKTCLRVFEALYATRPHNGRICSRASLPREGCRPSGSCTV